jgi:hypothetical protein
MKKFYFLFFLIITSIFSCRESTTQVDGSEVPKGAYFYEAYDKSDVMIIYGWFTMDIQGNTISGDWNFKETSIGSSQGPHHGTGKLQGSKHEESISMNLNPNLVDSNIFLSGLMSGDVFDGTWTYSGYAGNLASGKFHAVKNN